MLLIMTIIAQFLHALAYNHESGLFSRLLSNYNVLARPVKNSSSAVQVKLKVVLNQILELDERSQTLQLNIWLHHEWYDYYMQWNATDYGGVSDLRFPIGIIWRPDMLLYNSADANFESTQKTNMVVYNHGLVTWIPPGIVKFSCKIHTVWFPFDDQECFLKFGSWTYNGYKMDLEKLDNGWDMSEYIQNGEWMLMSQKVTKTTKMYKCCPEPYPDLKFYLRLRRRALYYGFNIILPSMIVSMATLFGFALPIESGEKITLEITILLSICVFLGMLTNMVPSTSDSYPLICVYFAGNMVVVSLSVVANVILLNLKYRSPDTHVMSPWIRKIMLGWLPWFLMMARPGHKFARSSLKRAEVKKKPMRKLRLRKLSPIFQPRDRHDAEDGVRSMIALIDRTHENSKFIADHGRRDQMMQESMNDWHFAAVVFDRLCLVMFSIFLFASACLIFSAPHYV